MGPSSNHSQAKGLRVRSSVKGGPGSGSGGVWLNHSQAKGLRVRSSVKVSGPIIQHSEAKGLRVRTPVGGLSRTVRLGVASAASVIALAVATPAAHADTRTDSSRPAVAVSFDLSAGADVAACNNCGILFNHSQAGAQRLRTR